MTVTFISNFMTHHQIAFCNEMYSLLGDDFRFIATKTMDADRVSLGWHNESAAYIILAVSILFFTWLGYKRGFINSFLDLARWTGSLIIAVVLYNSVADLLVQNFSISEEWQKPLSFFILFVYNGLQVRISLRLLSTPCI